MAHAPSPPTIAQAEVAAERPVFRGEGATAMFEVQIMSDLHLEFPNTLANLPSFEPRAPYLDIGQPRKKDYLDFLKAQAARFERVFVITGNHEYYASDRDTVNREIAEFCGSIANLHFLNMSSVLLNDNGHKVRVLGTTLWHHCPDFYLGHLEATVNDYSLIIFPEPPVSPEEEPKKRKLRAVDTNRWHAEEVAWLKAAIAEAEAAGEAVVVLTHHKPGNIMGASADWDSLLRPPVMLWGYGHTHSSHQWVVNDVLVASNQLGYLQLGEKAGFCPEFVITIDHNRECHIMRNDPDKNRREELARELAKIPMAAAPPAPPPPGPPVPKPAAAGCSPPTQTTTTSDHGRD